MQINRNEIEIRDGIIRLLLNKYSILLRQSGIKVHTYRKLESDLKKEMDSMFITSIFETPVVGWTNYQIWMNKYMETEKNEKEKQLSLEEQNSTSSSKDDRVLQQDNI